MLPIRLLMKPFSEYGAQILDGTAKPEDNPAYNAEVAAANANTPVNIGGGVTKPAQDLTSDDFYTPEFQALSYEDQMAAQYATLAAAGISNIGGGYNQSDSTNVFQDILGFGVETVADLPGVTGWVADQFDAPDSTYDPTGGNTISSSSSSNDDDSNSIFSGSGNWGGPSSAPSSPAPTDYGFGSAYNYAQGGMVKKDYGWGM